MAGPLTGNPKPFAHEWVKWSGSAKEKFPRLLDIGAPHVTAPKLIGEGLAQATIRLREENNVRAHKTIPIN